MTAAEHISDFKLTKYTPYLTLKGKQWGVFYVYFGENWLHYNGTTLYCYISYINTPRPRQNGHSSADNIFKYIFGFWSFYTLVHFF